MLITLQVEDSKAKILLEFLNNLDFVKVKRELSGDETELLLNERLEEYRNNPGSLVDLKEELRELKTKYGF